MGRTVVVCTRLDEDVVKLIDRIASKLRMSRAELIKQLIIEALGLKWEENEELFEDSNRARAS